ncbi:alpha/beta fold hydrolase [Nonomuraea sp. NPDC000554]|uniref:alpha/beta fold hydrolase n=1 Tax=Nonomuraea sp. NPDC000554 TaxID=3154259 RepID=UPI003333071D
MTTYVLVPGAWHGPWAWERVVPLLERSGARAVTPDLTYDRDAGLDDHVAEVVAALDAGDGDVVLVGHSYGGLVARQAADVRPVEHVVLVDGWAGPDGSSMFTLAPDAFGKAMLAAADGWRIPPPAPELFGVGAPEDVRWLKERLRPHPLRTFTDPTRLTGAVDRIPGTGIHCRPQTYPFDRFAQAVGYRTISVEGPHDVMLTAPELLAGLLLDVRMVQNQEARGLE